ncbi:uncharacterized protein LOC131686718 [Topomyia yanbarensis]|uniref:uncharacterized protein LOC131686718 n=1 Tax=Topomyia yanbarensis TaxID=2498891 RepID=UPI00273BA8F1|nr:uncharacterized protein LOC131686718 [Topomyia yanbarensis]
MKQFNNPITLAIVLTSVLGRHVKCIANSKSSSTISTSTEGYQQLKDLKTDGTSSFWSPHPEYYHERDRYNRPDRTDFVTSYGGYENKYGGGIVGTGGTQLYGNKDRLGYNSFSTGSGGSYYTPGGVFDRKQPPYGPPQPVDFPPYGHDYENNYDYNPHIYGQSFGHSYGGGKELTKSVLIPLAGAALLGIAAALVANPVLLHLGAAVGKRRKRRDVTANAHDIVYRAWLMKPPTSKEPAT